MKGFTKGKGKGKKFIPTSKKKSSLSKSDIKPRELTVKKYIPIDERKKQSLECPECNSVKIHKNKDKGTEGFGKGDHACNNCGKTFNGKGTYRYKQHVGNDYGFGKATNPDNGVEYGLMRWNLVFENGDNYGFQTNNKKEAERAIADWNENNGSGTGKMLTMVDRKNESRSKQTLGQHAGHPIVKEDNGKIYEEFDDHYEEIRNKNNLDGAEGRLSEPALVIASVEGTRLGHTSPSYLSDDELEDEMDKFVEFRSKVMKNKRSDENDAVFRRTQNFLKELANEATERDLQKRGVGGRSKLSLFGAKSPQEQKLEAKEDKINQNNKLAKETEKVEKKEAKADEKTAKALRKTDEQKLKSNEKSIRFLEKQIKGLQEKPAKYGVNAQSQLDVIEQARNDLKNLQSETDEVRTRLNEVQ